MLNAARRAGTYFDTRQIFEWVPGRAIVTDETTVMARPG